MTQREEPSCSRHTPSLPQRVWVSNISHSGTTARPAQSRAPGAQKMLEGPWTLAALSLLLPRLLASGSLRTQQRQRRHFSWKSTPQAQPCQSWKGFAFVSIYNHIPDLWQDENRPSHSSSVFFSGPMRHHPFKTFYFFFPLKVIMNSVAMSHRFYLDANFL